MATPLSAPRPRPGFPRDSSWAGRAQRPVFETLLLGCERPLPVLVVSIRLFFSVSLMFCDLLRETPFQFPRGMAGFSAENPCPAAHVASDRPFAFSQRPTIRGGVQVVSGRGFEPEAPLPPLCQSHAPSLCLLPSRCLRPAGSRPRGAASRSR